MASIKDLLNIFQQASGLPAEVGHTIATHESGLGKYSDTMEDIGVTKGVFHITKGSATSVMTDEEKLIFVSFVTDYIKKQDNGNYRNPEHLKNMINKILQWLN